MPYTLTMRFSSGLHRRRSPRAGFSLVELSIVVVILSIISMLGLEAATAFLNRSVYQLTEAQMREIDKAIDAYYNAYGYLPCPADATLAPTHTDYGFPQDCSGLAPFAASDVVAGMIPFRVLNLPASMALDGFGSKIYYFASQGLTAASGFAARPGTIEIRSGKLAQPCNTLSNCSVLALPDFGDPTVSTGAAYAVVSMGSDQRGALSRQGTPINACAHAGDQRIDAQNCYAVAPSGSLLPATIPNNVLYDSRFNAGSEDVNYFDDLIVWRPKDKL